MADLPNPFIGSALVLETGAGSATVETNIPLSAVVANSSSCGVVESRHEHRQRQGANASGREPLTEPTALEAGVASGPQDSISVSAISAEGVAIVVPEETPVPVAAVASNLSFEPTPMAPATFLPGVETRRDEEHSSPAAFSFQPDFEKRFDEIMRHT